MHKILTVTVLLLAALFLYPETAAADEKKSFFPEISSLDYTDLNYRQLQEDIAFFYKSAAGGSYAAGESPDTGGGKLPPLMFYSYKVSSDINIFSIASQAGLPYETIASLNGISSTAVNLYGKQLLIPSQPGIYLSAKPETDLEFISRAWRAGRLSEALDISVNGREYNFFPGESFHNVERAYFLGILFANPLPRGIVTSGYGIRKSPFTGHNTFHNGIDLAAPAGTVVYAAREGIITDSGFNSTYGRYITVSHEGGYETFYGHLNKIFVELHDKVNSTMIIAEVGSTGLSTGPHLHFEVRKDGKSKDPSKLTPGLE